MRVNFTQMKKNLDSLQAHLSRLEEVVNDCDMAENNRQAVCAHDKLMFVVERIKKNLLPFYTEIEETVSKSHNQLYRKLKKEQRTV